MTSDVQATLASIATFAPLGSVSIRGLAASAPAFRVSALGKLPVIEQPLLGREQERTRFAASRPGFPVTAFAQPALTTTALTRPPVFFSDDFARTTGAA